jgi:hypothetical protein
VSFANSIGLELPRLPELLAGSEPISIDLARRIVESIGGSVEFWLTRDGQYRDNLANIEADSWAKEFPTSQMTSWGWIDKPVDWQAQIETYLDFFNVGSLSQWQASYGSLLETANFRTTDKVPTNPNAVIAWLRQAERIAEGLPDLPYDPDGFRSALSNVRQLTRTSDPKRFLPSLESLCADVGVSVVVLRAPRGCPVSGVARLLEDGTPLIALSARYLSDDHFWFSFFHEAGHVLMHDPTSVFIDELERNAARPSSQFEIEADAFATNVLVPVDVRERLLKERPTPALLHRIAKELEISTGILVGQLQFHGTLRFNSPFNRLKKRYRWNEASLEKA